MSINKNFVVKNGVEISTDLIYATSVLDKVGLGTTNPQTKLDVVGDITAGGHVTASGPIRATNGSFIGFTTTTRGLNVGVGGTALKVSYVANGGNRTGINTSTPKNPLDVYASASIGQTAAYLHGDLVVTGNISGVSFDGVVSAGGTAGFTDLNVSGIITANNKEIYTQFDVINNSNLAFQYQNTGIGFTQNRDNPVLYLVRGTNYRFNVNSTGHPFFLKTSRTTGISSQYNAGVQNNGVQVGILTFRVPFDAPRKLYYQCSTHTSMGSTIYVLDQGVAGVNTESFVASNIDISGIATIGTLNVTNNATIGGATSIGDNLYVAGISTFVGISTFQNNVYIQGGLSATGVITATAFNGSFNGNLSGIATGASNVSITNSATLASTCNVAFVNASSGYSNILVDNGNLLFVPSTNTLYSSNFQGNLTGIASTASTVTLTDESANTSCSVIYSTDATGNRALKTGSNLTFNSSNGTLTATTFSGSGSGLSSLNASNLSSGTVPSARLTGSYSISITGTATNATNFNVAADNATNATHYLIFTGGATGNQRPNSDTDLIYNPSTNTLSAGNFNSTSDINLKKDIEVITDATQIINQINGVRFAWKNNDLKSAGVIAQEVEKVLPELISERSDNGIKSVNYNGLVGVLIEAVKELSARVEELERKSL